eukprot:TRINITY_DN33502_c0_g1_i1.p1 TRINITY_DN33502_c0_g1~~TRINITY_DN33502_c0_g1_i1.p1  ORF type:complete len:210 (-),score=48.32 TRINITY_DN33502_c0_g1_i1:176-805(-)
MMKYGQLEEQVENLNEQIQKISDKNKEIEHVSKNIIKQYQLQNQPKVDNDNEESWLFYTQKNTSTEKISKQLNFSSNQITIELKCDEWSDEKSFWIDILQKLDNKWFQSKEILGKSLQNLKQLAMASIENSLHDELLIIVRNLPKNEKQFQEVLPKLIGLCDAVTTGWSQIDSTDGKVAVVLESEQRIDVLNYEKDQIKVKLYVEALGV